jgi:hypothetical protein
VVRLLGGDRFAFARAIIATGALMQLLLAHLVALLATRLAPAPEGPGSAPPDETARHVTYAIAFIMLCNTAVFAWATCGLETPLYLCVLSLFITRFFTLMRADELSLRDALVLGALAGLAVLARLDFVVVSPVLLLLLLVALALSAEPTAPRRGHRAAHPRSLAAVRLRGERPPGPVLGLRAEWTAE